MKNVIITLIVIVSLLILGYHQFAVGQSSMSPNIPTNLSVTTLKTTGLTTLGSDISFTSSADRIIGLLKSATNTAGKALTLAGGLADGTSAKRSGGSITLIGGDGAGAAGIGANLGGPVYVVGGDSPSGATGQGNVNLAFHQTQGARGYVGIRTQSPTSPLQVMDLPTYANNAAAIGGGLTAGAFYHTGVDPDPVCIVH